MRPRPGSTWRMSSARTRWRTPLPFPVQVVARVEVIDQISQGKLTTEYRYHHGYWDGTEREFRGFGMVEQFDTETFADYHAAGAHGPRNASSRYQQHFSPPSSPRPGSTRGRWMTRTATGRSWTGPRYWPDDPQALAHMDVTDAFLQSLADPAPPARCPAHPRGQHAAYGAYALDGTEREDRPFTVTEQAYGLREEDPARRAATASASASSSRTPWPNAPRNGSAATSR